MKKRYRGIFYGIMLAFTVVSAAFISNGIERVSAAVPAKDQIRIVPPSGVIDDGSTSKNGNNTGNKNQTGNTSDGSDSGESKNTGENGSGESKNTDKEGSGESKNTDDSSKKSTDGGSSKTGLPAEKDIKKFIKNLEKNTIIPTVCVYTEGGAEVVSREDYVDCAVYTLNCDKEYKIAGDTAGIRVRGNSTAYGGNVAMIRANQVPYKLKFDSKINMFGLNDDAKCKKWVLIKAEDNLLKNDIAFRLGRTILHDYNYCSDGILVHMYLNGKFMGIYELCEQSQVNKNRINISEPKENYKGVDIGYLVEIDNYGEKPFFRIYYENATVKDLDGRQKKFKSAVYSVKSDVYSDDQTQFIKDYINKVFKIVYEACEHQKYYVLDENNELVKAKKKFLKQTDADGNPIDPAEIVINSVMNLESVADIYLVYEIAKDRDVGEGSFYMYADFAPESQDSRLTFTCPWDFEWAFGGPADEIYAALFNTEDFARVYEERSNPWFILLMKQDWFKKKVSDRWRELRTAPAGKKNDAITLCMKEESEMLETYSADLGKISSNQVKSAKYLIDWVNKRIKFLDGWLLDD